MQMHARGDGKGEAALESEGTVAEGRAGVAIDR